MQYKSVEFDGAQYSIGQVSAKTGSKLLAKLLPHLAPFLGESFDFSAVAKVLPAIDEKDFESIQDSCMTVVFKVQDNGALKPVFVAPNQWIEKPLEYDAPAVLALTVHALVYNLAPFFVGGGLQKIMASLAALSQ